MFYNKADTVNTAERCALIESLPKENFTVTFNKTVYRLHQVYNSGGPNYRYILTSDAGMMIISAFSTSAINIQIYNNKTFKYTTQTGVTLSKIVDSDEFNVTRTGIVKKIKASCALKPSAVEYKVGDFLHKDKSLYGVVIVANHDALVIEDKHGKTAIIYSTNTCLLNALDIVFMQS